MKKERTIVLTGAGSVLDFGAPSTCNLTKALLVDKKVGAINKRIYILLRSKKIYTNINFESIIHFLDSLIHFLRSDVISGYRDIYNSFCKIDKETLNLLIQIDKLDLEDCNDIKFRDKNYERAVKLLFYNYNYILYKKLAKYCSLRPEKKKFLELLKSWYFLKSITTCLRFYSLNYDRILPNEVDEIFDGYNYKKKTGFRISTNLPDISRIINARDIPIHFNLHGSIYWNTPIFNQSTFWSSCNNEIKPPSIYAKQINNGEPNHGTFLIPIITGYAKIRKAQVPPIREFFSSFEKDLLEADKFLIVGYSFADDHINNTIDTALMFNKKLEIDIVDFDEKGLSDNISKKISGKLKNINHNNTHYHMNGFSQYLETELK